MTDLRALVLAALLLLSAIATAGVGQPNGRRVPVDSVEELRAAMAAAQPGDTILVADGTYEVTGNLVASVAGLPSAPIVLRAASPRGVLLRFADAGSPVEGIRVVAPWWQVEGLDIEGGCLDDSDCEHAIHLAGDADHTVIRNNVLRDFNAQIKSNGQQVGGAMAFPDDVLVERNTLRDSRARNTANPVTKIDVVGGRRWIVRANTLADFQKGGGDQVSYGAFLKGNSRDGLFERNLVRCAWSSSGGTRIGLSLGGGGSGPPGICEDGTCQPEHQGGTLRNNLVMDCSDVGIYLNSAADTRLGHNTLYATLGIDVRFPASSADLRNNLVGGAIRNRDGGTSTSSGDLSGIDPATFADWFVDPANADFRLREGSAIVDQGVPVPWVATDFCNTLRNDGFPDIGALEYVPDAACRTDIGGGTPLDVLFADGFDPQGDAVFQDVGAGPAP
jgi:parallel beta-helix repeat protein